MADSLRLIRPWLSRGQVAHFVRLARLVVARGDECLAVLLVRVDTPCDRPERDPEEYLGRGKINTGTMRQRQRASSAILFIHTSKVGPAYSDRASVANMGLVEERQNSRAIRHQAELCPSTDVR